MAGNSHPKTAHLKPHQWKPGQSGNPNGRPKKQQEVQDKADDHVLEAIDTLVSVMQDKGAPHAARNQAAIAVLERRFGKPSQQVTVDANKQVGDFIESMGAATAISAGMEEQPGSIRDTVPEGNA